MIKGENTFAFSFQQRVIFFIIKARQYPKKSHIGQVTTLYTHLLHKMMEEHTVEKVKQMQPVWHPLRQAVWGDIRKYIMYIKAYNQKN